MQNRLRFLHCAAAAVAALCLGAGALRAQGPALATTGAVDPVITYSRNESGGRVSLIFPGADSTAMEQNRLRLIELAAAIRRGDFRSAWIFQNDHPAMQVLAERRLKLRCTVRPTLRGGDIVLLSEDDAVVAALHQVLSTAPPRAVRL